MIRRPLRTFGFLSLALAFAFGSGCTTEDNLSSKLKSFHWLQGEWKMTNDDEMAFESWKISDNRLVGVAYIIEDNGDTVISEYMTLQEIDSTIEFVADVEHNEHPIHFRWVKSENGNRFMNRDHDFPKWLVYEKKSEDSMVANIGDETREMQFTFKRFKK